jgi:hypothetical protein
MTPKLKIVPLADVMPLMSYKEEKVDFLRASIEKTGSIQNPIALAAAGNQKYLLLDDSAQLEAARKMRLKVLPAQVSSSGEAIKIDADIYVSCSEAAILKEFVERFPRSLNFVHNGNREKHPCMATRIKMHFPDHQEITADFRKCAHGFISPYLFLFLDFISHRYAMIERIYPEDFRTINLKNNSEKAILKIINISFQDLLFSARHGLLFPPGLLKFENGFRIIGINYPINVLNEKASLREKERFLRDLVNYRLNNGHPEYVRNGVYFLKH